MRKILGFVFLFGALLALAPPSDAALTQNAVVTAQTPNNGKCTFLQGTDVAATYKTCYTGGTNGSKIVGIWVTSNDASASHLVTVQLSTSTTAHCSPTTTCLGGAAVTIPISAGFANAVPAINMLSPTNWPGLPLDSQGNPYLFLSVATQTIEATFATSLTASDQVSVTIMAADF